MAESVVRLHAGGVTSLAAEEERRNLRIVEAILFASAVPVPEEHLAERLPDGADVAGLIRELRQAYAGRGINLVAVAGGWAFRTAEDLGWLLSRDAAEPKKLSRAAMETLAIVAYHQPVTRSEVEDIRGVSLSRGTLDLLLETGWVRMRGRRRTPGRPVTYGTTTAFLDHFGLESLGDLPGIEELKGAGLLDAGPGSNFTIPQPDDRLAADEDPLDPEDLAAGDGREPSGAAGIAEPELIGPADEADEI